VEFVMTQATLKRVLKQALVETMRENRDLLTSAVAEAMEDMALVTAIREGRKSKRVSRKQVMSALRAGRRFAILSVRPLKRRVGYSPERALDGPDDHSCLTRHERIGAFFTGLAPARDSACTPLDQWTQRSDDLQHICNNSIRLA
jgi:hypothetical protein